MLPPPLTPPLPTRSLGRVRWRIPWLALAGILLVGAGLVGTVVWFAALSPYGYIRFSLTQADRTISISRPGAYLVFEEYGGAAQADLPSRLAITMIDDQRRSIPIESLLQPGERGAPFAYNVPPNEGRAIARFVAPRSGRYFLQVQPLEVDTADASGYRDGLPAGLAVGRELDMAWLRTPLGLVLLGLVPLAAGTVVLLRVVVRRRRRTAQPPGRAFELVR